MRVPSGLLAGLAASVCVGVVGCGSGPASTDHLRSAASSPLPAPIASPSAAPAEAQSVAAPAAGPAEPETRAGARAAAAYFYRLYSAGKFSASWDLLSPTARRAIPRAIWISVHNGCTLGGGSGQASAIKSVFVFGNAAIVTETIADDRSRPGKAEAVFNYAGGHWAYAPSNLGIYHHGSVAADVAAATALGFCTRQSPPL
jgi:hypothetical protein